MPLYEYKSEDGEIITLLRTMATSDDPVEDPQGKGRVFKKIMSTTFIERNKKSKKQISLRGASRYICCCLRCF